MAKQLKFGFQKNIELRDTNSKYEDKHRSFFACEKIRKDEVIYRCDKSYLNGTNDKQILCTREDLLKMCRQYPENRAFILRYNYMIDDDLFKCPVADYKEKNLMDICILLNHSCNGNCGFDVNDSDVFLAKCDIDVGEELTFDYQLIDTEASLHEGDKCKCGFTKCRGILHFNHYRNKEWIQQNYKYCTDHVRKRIDELSTKWFSPNCYLKRYKEDVGLTAFKRIMKNELIATYSTSSSINKNSHYIRHSDEPNCYVNKEGEVFAINHIAPGTELTLKFD